MRCLDIRKSLISALVLLHTAGLLGEAVDLLPQVVGCFCSVESGCLESPDAATSGPHPSVHSVFHAARAENMDRPASDAFPGTEAAAGPALPLCAGKTAPISNPVLHGIRLLI